MSSCCQSHVVMFSLLSLEMHEFIHLNYLDLLKQTDLVDW